MTRGGFVALAGRPNVGKSTFVNAVVGEKVAIVSDRPQTTRRAIRGVYRCGEAQVVLVDLPGVQRPRDALTTRMAQRVRHELEGADAALLMLAADQGVGPGDRFIAKTLAGGDRPVTIAVNKVDRLSRSELIAVLQQATELEPRAEVFPISARTGAGVPALVEHLIGLLPAGPFYYAPEQRSDQSESAVLAELVREQVLARTREEVPHAVEVEIESIEQTRPDLIGIDAVILVETESQKGILIGAGGRMVKSIGVAARRAIERQLGAHVHLRLSVRVRRHWRADERLLDRLGIE